MKKITLFLYIILCCQNSQSQSAELLLDINPGSDGSFNFSTDISSIEFQDKLYFVAKNSIYGLEMWVYDGNETKLFKDINPGIDDSDVDFMFLVGDKLIFSADDGVHGYELWVSDGTSEGTIMLKDILEGPDSGMSKCCFSYASRNFHVFNDELYFNANIENNGVRFFKTDGTSEGTIELARLNANQRRASGFLEWNGELYFEVGFEGFWKTDGTSNGTVQIKSNINGTGSSSFEPKYLTDMGDYILLTEGYDQDIWISDGTLEGTVLVKEMSYSAAQNNVGHYFFRKGTEAFFPGSYPANNTEMWKTDGTLNGTIQISEIETNPGNIPYYPKRRVLFDDKVYYIGGKNEIGSQIYYTTGLPNETFILVDLNEKIGGQVYFQSDLVASDKYLFFVAGRSFNRELWYSDGTSEGTYEIEIAENGESTPERLRIFKDKLFFFANTNESGYEPYILEINQLTSSTSSMTKSMGNVFPNPVSNVLNIEIEHVPERIEIFNVNGVLEKIDYNTREINISECSAGLKIVKFENPDGSVNILRFIKQ